MYLYPDSECENPLSDKVAVDWASSIFRAVVHTTESL